MVDLNRRLPPQRFWQAGSGSSVTMQNEQDRGQIA